MKRLTLMMTMFLLLLAGNSMAQQVERELTKAERKALQARIDSLQFAEAEQAIKGGIYCIHAP